MRKDKPVKIVCGHCGSDNVTRDALAHWNVETQDWEASCVLDNADCEDCGESEARLIEVPI